MAENTIVARPYAKAAFEYARDNNALAEWESLDIAAPELFKSIASLQRPSWGSWNGMLGSLKKAKRSIGHG